MNRRGFLAGLFAAPIAMAIEPLAVFDVMPVRGRTTVEINSRLIKFRKDIAREYVRKNLFTPFNEGPDEPWCKRLGATEERGGEGARRGDNGEQDNRRHG